MATLIGTVESVDELGEDVRVVTGRGRSQFTHYFPLSSLKALFTGRRKKVKIGEKIELKEVDGGGCFVGYRIAGLIKEKKAKAKSVASK